MAVLAILLPVELPAEDDNVQEMLIANCMHPTFLVEEKFELFSAFLIPCSVTQSAIQRMLTKAI